jgi:hypothetical protein
MGNGVHISQKGKVRRLRKKTEQEVILVSGKYLHDFIITLTFSSGRKELTRVVDFLPLFQQYVKGDNLKYFAPANFKKFIVKNENIYWGKNEDVIFSSSMLAGQKKSTDTSEEILYII